MEVSSGLYNRILHGSFLCLLLLVVGYRGCLGCSEDERVGLLNLKASMNHPNGTVLSSWGEGDVGDCCKWERVTCDNKTNRAVIQLDLSVIRYDRGLGKWNLNASLLLPFHQLQILLLSWNLLAGFQGLLTLKKLRVLDLSGNYLTTIPVLSALSSLKVLNLEYNHLKSSQLQGLNYSSRIQVLFLAGNNLMGGIPEIIGSLKSLKSLSLANNNFNDSLSIEGLCKLSNLEELDISGNGIGGNLSPCFKNLTSLSTLDLSYNDFKGSIPPALFSSLKVLRYISLSYNDFEGSFDFTLLFNHSKLVVFELVGDKKNILKVETENSLSQLPLFQLRVFRLSNCVLNWESGVIPSFLSNQSELRVLELKNNGIKGDLPTWLLINNLKLESLRLSGNQFRGPLALGLNSKQAYMKVFDISSNSIQGVIPLDISSILPNLLVLNMSWNALHGNFPASIGDMKSLLLLDLSNNNLSGLLPQHFMKGCISLETLILSNNKFHGNFPENSNLTNLSTLFLDNNSFSGMISRGLLNSPFLEMLDLGNNSFYGQIPDWIGNFPDLSSLVLSRNDLGGVLPTGFCELAELQHLDLSGNKLGQSIPPCFNLSNMQFLHMQNNKLTGPIPDVLSTLPSLFILDLKDNKFWGTIPPWIGSLITLRVLLLGGTELHGSIPSDLCRLRSIRMMDLSHNNLSGSIPPCLNNLTFGSIGEQDGIFLTSAEYISRMFATNSYENQLSLYVYIDFQSDAYGEGERVDFTTKWRFESYEGKILPIMSGLDLSRNNLAGSIPPELGDLSDIFSLNLSGNHLTGSIPESFTNLTAIESLDLSHNMLIGQIPPQMIKLNNLAVFTVAYNNLSGKLPERKAQFATFKESSYEGNPLLCGLPLNRSCSPARAVSGTSPPANSDHNEGEEYNSWKVSFLWSFGESFGVVFLGIVAFLYFNSYYRELLFYFIAKHLPFLPVRGW